MLMPPDVGQPVHPSDALTVTLSGGTAEVDAGCFGIYYTDLPGTAAKLHSWGDISGAIQNIKPVEVDFTTSATAAVWNDTVITTTENLLKADTWYAVLGYLTDTAVLCMGIRAPETGNLRICGPGPTSTFRTDNYFIYMAGHRGVPYIPTFNANNRGGVFLSAAAVATSTAVKGSLILAELASSFVG